MFSPAQKWLQAKLKQLEDVRSCVPSLDTNADLIVRTWVGMRTNIYFVDQTISVRQIRNTVHENTRAYQGSIFLINDSLLPKDKERLYPKDWLLALHELHSERIYSYLPTVQSIHAVHLDYVADGKEREAWHGEPETIKLLRTRNVTMRLKVLRGAWMMADFGPNPYWKEPDFRATRFQARRQQQFKGTGQYVWGQYDMGGHPGGADRETLNELRKTELQRSFEVLGLPETANKETVKSTFRELARKYHPDVTGLEKTRAEVRFREISAAYEFIKTKKRWR